MSGKASLHNGGSSQNPPTSASTSTTATTSKPHTPLLSEPPTNSTNALWPPRAYDPSAVDRTGWRDRLSNRSSVETWEFPGWGSHFTYAPSEQELQAAAHEAYHRKRPGLGEWQATAICTNDVLSSCMYAVGLVTQVAGKLAPLVLLLAAVVLFLVWGMYAEGISALPFNGGAYNILINTTSKPVASVGGVLILIAYVASSVVSATTAAYYMQLLADGVSAVWAPIGILLAMGCVSVLGIEATSYVAVPVLVVHTLTLTLLCTGGVMYMVLNQDTLWANLNSPFPDVDFMGDEVKGSVFTALFLGYATSMVGVSGFEDSSQFVEEQAPGVFIRTLENMWLGIAVFNPLLALVTLGTLPLQTILSNPYTSTALVARQVCEWLLPGHSGVAEAIVAIDATLVLSAAVLAGYVGVNGLIARMTSDRCLPPSLLSRSWVFGTLHNIRLLYFLLCASLVLVLWGDIEDLAGVYSLSFLSALASFAVGVLLLKFKRPSLPREFVTSTGRVAAAFAMIFIGILGHIMGIPDVVSVICYFVGGAAVLFLLQVQRAKILRLLVVCFRHMCPGLRPTFLMDEHAQATSQPAVFFCKKDDLEILNKAVLYVLRNEEARHLLVVHCYEPGKRPPPHLQEHVRMLDEMYPRIKANLLTVQAHFGPDLVEWLSKELHIPKSSMFISCPDDEFTVKMHFLEGVRVITAAEAPPPASASVFVGPGDSAAEPDNSSGRWQSASQPPVDAGSRVEL